MCTTSRAAQIGWGDELIASGQARLAQHGDARRVQILDANGAPRWHAAWDGNPRFARPDERGDFQRISNAPNCRPYIAGKTPARWTWREFQCAPGELYFTLAEQSFGLRHQPQIVIEPNIKPGASPNKQWGGPRWRAFAALAIAAGYRLTQLGAVGTRVVPGAQLIETPDFRRACAVLSRAQAYVGPDGGLMHSAAALNVPAIVIRGAFISEKCTGYASQRNLFTGKGLGCGMRVLCSCCVRAMAEITPETVVSELRGILEPAKEIA